MHRALRGRGAPRRGREGPGRRDMRQGPFGAPLDAPARCSRLHDSALPRRHREGPGRRGLRSIAARSCTPIHLSPCRIFVKGVCLE